MSRPDWCPEWAWDEAIATLAAAGLIDPSADRIAPVARALLSAKREGQDEIDRLNKVIDRMQAIMSSQAEQWTRSMAEAKREGMMEAAGIAGMMEKLGPAFSAAQAIRQKAQEIGK